MAKITYVGDDQPGTPARIQWGNHNFELNKATEVTDPHIIAKARNNPHFKVSGNNGIVGKATAEDVGDDDLTAAEKESAYIAEAEAYDQSADREAPEAVKRGPGRPPKPKE